MPIKSVTERLCTTSGLLSLSIVTVSAHFFLESGYSLFSEIFILLAVLIVCVSWLSSRVLSNALNLSLMIFILVTYLSESFRLIYPTLVLQFKSQSIGLFLTVLVDCFLLIGLWLFIKKIDSENLRKVLLTFIGVSFLSVLLFNPKDEHRIEGKEPSTSEANVYYIVIDGHLGISGFPSEISGATEAANQIRSLYLGLGFEVYDRAYSNFYWTQRSVYSILENSVQPFPPSIGTEKYYLPENRLFNNFRNKGYAASLFYSDHFDLCTAWQEASCDQYKVNSLLGDLPRRSKYPLVMGSLLGRFVPSRFLNEIRRMFGVVNSIQTIDMMIDRVTSERNGRFTFTHLLVPHEPYVLRNDCSMKANTFWAMKTKNYYQSITPTEYQARWQDYLNQLKCTHKKLAQFIAKLKFEGVYEKSTIIIHSDHGSRMAVRSLFDHEFKNVQDRDYIDFFSSFLVIKKPNGKPSRIETKLPISHVIADILGWKRNPDFLMLYDNSGGVEEVGKMPDF
ncbi:MAG: hypothetical protein ACI9FD_002847 [Gammaproteobacteria bacterium]|jgi:hypothetical protein